MSPGTILSISIRTFTDSCGVTQTRLYAIRCPDGYSRVVNDIPVDVEGR